MVTPADMQKIAEELRTCRKKLEAYLFSVLDPFESSKCDSRESVAHCSPRAVWVARSPLEASTNPRRHAHPAAVSSNPFSRRAATLKTLCSIPLTEYYTFR
jgi:hypothetical protein